MNQTKHLSVGELINYLFEQDLSNINIIETHLKECKKCAQKFTKIQMILKKAFLTKKTTKFKRKKTCLNENLIAGYIDNSLSIEDAIKVEKHLTKCNYCLNKILEVFYATEKLKSAQLTFSSLPEKIKKYIATSSETFILKIQNTIKGIKILNSNLPEYEMVPLSSTIRGKDISIKKIKIIQFSLKIFETNISFSIIPENSDKINLNLKFSYKKVSPNITIKLFRECNIIAQDKIKDKKIEFIYTLTKGDYQVQFIKSKKKFNLFLEVI